MIVVAQRYRTSYKRAASINRSISPRQLINGSFPKRTISRQFPLVAGLHKAADGALIGVLVAVGLMSTLALHWQHLWTVAFARLETTRDLTHRLTDSTAMLERYLLQNTSLPLSMVPTKADNLLYLESPYLLGKFQSKGSEKLAILRGFVSNPIKHGY